MNSPNLIAYRSGQTTALDDFAVKEAFAPLAALAPVAMQGLRMAGTWAAGKAIPWLARGAASLGRSAVQQLPGAAAQTGVSMAADKLTQPRSASGPPVNQMPGLVNPNRPGMPPGFVA